MPQWPRMQPGQLLRRARVAGQVVVDRARVPLALHRPLPHDRTTAADVRPIRRQPVRVVDDRHVPLLVPPVAVLGRRVVVEPDARRTRPHRPLEHRLHRRRAGSAGSPSPPAGSAPPCSRISRGVLGLAPGRVDGHDRPGQVQGAEQVRDRRRSRSSRPAPPPGRGSGGSRGPRADQVQAPGGRSAFARRADLPSMAMGVSPVASHAAAIHRPNRSAKASGRGRRTPGRRCRGSGCRWPAAGTGGRRPPCGRPYSAICSHPSAPPMIAQGDGQDVGQGVDLLPCRSAGRAGRRTRVASGRGIGLLRDAPGVAGSPELVSQFIVRKPYLTTTRTELPPSASWCAPPRTWPDRSAGSRPS